MPKASGGTLTGGTKDVNPQWYRLAITGQPSLTATAATSAVANASQSFPTPVPKYPSSNGKAVVMEILKIMWAPDYSYNLAAEEGVITETVELLSAFSPTVVASGDGRVIDYLILNAALEHSTGTGIAINRDVPQLPVIHDLTDGAGHGVLVATDAITLAAQVQVSGIGGSFTATGWQVICSILYRFKEITLAEYIGIVQSQQ